MITGSSGVPRPYGTSTWSAGFAGAFEFQKDFLSRKTAGESGEFAVGSDHPVTRDQDGERIATNRGADSAHGTWTTYLAGNLCVGPCAPVGNCREGFPNLGLKRCASGCAREIKSLAFSIEIFSELPLRHLKDGHGLASGSSVERHATWFFILPQHRDKACRACHQGQWSDG